MPRKIRQLIADLEKAGFVNRGGKGSHRNFTPQGIAQEIRQLLTGHASAEMNKNYTHHDLSPYEQR